MRVLNALRLDDWITHMVVAPGDLGYWLVSRKQVVYPFGNAELHQIELGRLQPKADQGKATVTVSPQGKLDTDLDGFFRGDPSQMKLQGAIIDMAVTLDRRGYWMVGTDGGVFTFGSAQFYGSLGNRFRHNAYPYYALMHMSEGRSKRLKPIHLQLSLSSVPA